jgi:hypothetical protein
MVGSLISLLRVALCALAAGGLVMVWRFLPPSVSSLFASRLGVLGILLEFSLLFALALAPLALIGLAVRPRLWKFCALPLLWTLVATIILRPGILVGGP